jgi:hypothetical protein
MRLLLAIFLPPVAFFTIGRPIAGIISTFLCVAVIGWPISVIWAVYALSQYRTEQKINKALARARGEARSMPTGDSSLVQPTNGQQS